MTEHRYLDLELSDVRTWPWWPDREEARISAGFTGHENEIVVTIDPWDDPFERPVPDLFVDFLASMLPETWKLQNRSTRIEIHPSGHFNGGWHVDDLHAVGSALADMGLRPRMKVAGT
jgi:hypothetical protein